MDNLTNHPWLLHLFDKVLGSQLWHPTSYGHRFKWITKHVYLHKIIGIIMLAALINQSYGPKTSHATVYHAGIAQRRLQE
jgi:hypothetical protein